MKVNFLGRYDFSSSRLNDTSSSESNTRVLKAQQRAVALCDNYSWEKWDGPYPEAALFQTYVVWVFL